VNYLFLELFQQRLSRDCRRLDQLAQFRMESAYLNTTGLNTVHFKTSTRKLNFVNNIVLITVDCLRARNVSCYGYEQPTTPQIDEIAADGIQFNECFANGPFTSASFPSILGSIYFNMYEQKHFPEKATLLSEAFGDAGYETIGLNAANPNVGCAFDYNQGFDAFVDWLISYPSPSTGQTSETSTEGLQIKRYLRNRFKSHDRAYEMARRAYEEIYNPVLQPYKMLRNYVSFFRGETPNAFSNPVCPSAATVVDEAIEWLDSRTSEQPFFMWLHLMDPHSWYDPDPDHLTALGYENESRLTRLNANRALNTSDEAARPHMDVLKRLYDGTVRQVDTAVGRLYGELDERGLSDDSYLIFTSDHGEEFLEHGRTKHSDQLHSELIDVPLIVNGPEVPAVTVDEPVQLLDLAPTLLNLVGASVPDEYLGADHSAAIHDPAAAVSSAPVVSETPAAGNRRLVSVRNEAFTYIRNWKTDARVLFDRNVDPHEQHDISDERPDIVEKLDLVAEDHVDFVTENRITIDEKSEDVSPDIKQQLADLGYK